MPQLRIDVSGQQFVAALPSAVVRIGRDVECDLRIDDASVGAVHASIEPLPGGGFLLKDANSGRPTRVNGLGVKRVVLNSGDVVEIGPARITFFEGEVPASVPAPRAPSRAEGARPSPRAVERAPERAVVPAAAPRAVPSAVPAAAPAVAESPSPAPPASPARAAGRPRAAVSSSSGSGKKLTGALVVLGVFAAVAVLGAQLLGSGGDSTEQLSRLKSDLDRAKALAWEGGDLPAAMSMLERLAKSDVEGIRSDAQHELDAWGKRIAVGDRDFEGLIARAHRMDAATARGAVESLAVKHGAAIARRHEGMLDRLAKARDAWIASGAGKAGDASDAFVGEDRFAAALAVWDEFERGAPAVEETRIALETGRASVREAAERAFTGLQEKAAATASKDGPGAAATMLRDRMPDYAGTPQAPALVAEAIGYDKKAGALSSPSPTAKTPEAPAPTVATPSMGEPAEPTPPPAPPPPAATLAWKEASAKVEAALIARKIPEALAAAEEAVRAAGSSSHAVAAHNLRYDVSLAQNGLELLARTIHEHPDRFLEVELGPKFVASLVDADLEHVTLAVRGGQAKHRWSSIEPKRLATILEMARIAPRENLPAAQWLASLGARDAAERLVAAHVEAGGDAEKAFERVAHWRGEVVPKGGYVLFEGRFVTGTQRERLLLEAKIAAAAARVGSKDAAARRAAYDELTALGAPAKPAFARALTQRRAAAIEEIAALKVWTSGKTRTRLQQELEKRRAAAIALIENEQAYPYPSATHAGQEEVNRLVGLVRQVWSQPFDLVAAWDPKVVDTLALVTEVDEVLAKVEDGYAPDLDALKARINQAIDVPGIAPDDYSRKVLAFNERVATTAGREEKDNVRAVNEYRIMMGRHAVKIEERLVRAARGHSIEMRVKGYFAHESPTPERSSPGKRTARQGYSAGVGENIAMGTLTGRAAFDAWFHSSGHHRNMLSRGWTDLGAGRSGGSWWTQNFGAMTGKNLGEPAPLGEPAKDVAPEPDDVEGPSAAGGPAVPDEAPPGAPPDAEPPPEPPAPPDPGMK